MCQRNDSSFTSGFFLGAVVGGFLGVLFAPEEGSKTRDKLKKRLENDVERGMRAAQEINEKIEEAKEKAEPLISEMKEKLQPVLEKIESLSSEAKDEVASYVEEVKEKIEDNLESGGSRDDDGMKKRFFRGIRK